MATNSSISNFKRWPWPFISALFIFGMLQVYLNHSPQFWKYVQYNIRFGEEESLRLECMLREIPVNAPFKKVLIIGTSQAREGIDIGLLNALFQKDNVRIYNLAIGGSSHPVDNFMLRQRLMALKPDAVVYMPFVESFFAPYKVQPANNLEYFINPQVLPYMFKHLRWEDYDVDMRGDLMDAVVGYGSFLYRFRNQFQYIFLASLQYKLGLLPRPAARDTYFTGDSPPIYFTKLIEEYRKKERFRYTRYTDLYQDLFERFAQEMLQHKIRFVVLSPPVHPLMSAICSKQIQEAYDGYLTEAARRYDFRYTSNADLPPFGAEEFVDFTHLNVRGKERFTRYLEKYFRQSLNLL